MSTEPAPDPASPPIRRRLDGLLAIGPHPLDAQLRALAAYAARVDRPLDVLWTLLPGEDPAAFAPDSGFPVLVFDDDIAGFPPDQRGASDPGEAPEDDRSTDWHLAHARPRPKRPTSHLPVYGAPAEDETAADAVLRVDGESLDRQLARVEAWALRSAVRIRGVYVARDRESLRVMLRDFAAVPGAGPVLWVCERGSVEVHR